MFFYWKKHIRSTANNAVLLLFYAGGHFFEKNM